MHARVPQDVDLDDRLLFGLTAMRFGELAIGCLAAVAAWRFLPAVGGVFGLVLVAAGAALAWGSWRGRGGDHWVVAATLFVVRTHRLEVRGHPVIPRFAVRARRAVPRPTVVRSHPPRLRRSAEARARAVLRVLDGSSE